MLVRIEKRKREGKRSSTFFCFCICDGCQVELLRFGLNPSKKKTHFCHQCNIKERKAGGKIALQRVQTTRDRYGVDSVFQSTEIREQIKQTSLERYGCISFLDSSQGRKCLMSSSLARWGVLHPSQADEIKIKKEETTFLHYGVKNPSQAEEVKLAKEKTTLLHYGVKNPYQSLEIKEKIKQTNLKRYGVEFTHQNNDIRKKAQRNQKFSQTVIHWKTQQELVCTASYELAFVNWCNSNQIDFDWQIPHKMPDGRTYIIDAFIKTGEFANTWVEIKGYFTKIGLEKWNWFHSEHPNDSQLWNREILVKNGILEK